MFKHFKFTRTEFAGSLGDLGTLLPLSVGLILINHLDATSIFFGVGIFYIVTGLYFRVTCPVEPMKVVSAYAIATGIAATQIQASCLWIFVILFVIGITGFIDVISRYISKPIIRGVQLSTGILLLSQGVKLMTGNSAVQVMQNAAEPYLRIEHIAFLPFGIILGFFLGIVTLMLLDNKHLPAALVVVGAGLLIGALLGKHESWDQVTVGFNLPQLLPYGLPTVNDFSFALFILAFPQVPMTLGNAVIANADLTAQYFQEEGSRVTNKSLCLSMALANLGSFFIGCMPVCHGAGGLASRYRFGARTAGSNIIIGSIFLLIALFFGKHALSVIQLIPFSVLGVLLVFAGAQLALTILDLKTRKDLFITILIVGITLATNLAAGFLTGIVVAALLKWDRISV